MIMMIPTQVTALGFIKLVSNMNLEDSFIPLIVPTIAAPVTLFLYETVYGEYTAVVTDRGSTYRWFR
mgnify:CR=1 FL=1